MSRVVTIREREREKQWNRGEDKLTRSEYKIWSKAKVSQTKGKTTQKIQEDSPPKTNPKMKRKLSRSVNKAHILSVSTNQTVLSILALFGGRVTCRSLYFVVFVVGCVIK